MLKRICAFCLIMVLMASLVTVVPVSAASESKLQLFMDLGLIEGVDDFGLIPSRFSRGDFAKSLCLMERNESLYSPSDENIKSFASDIEGNANAGYIAAVLSAGYMETDNEGAFNPEKSISLRDAVTALVRMLGYEPMVQANGGTYDDYYAVAVKKGVLKGVTVENNEKLSSIEAAELMTNTMGAGMFLPHNIDYGEICLWDRWNITEHTGKLLATSNMGLFIDRTNANYINVGGKIYYTKLLLDNELVGSVIDFYTISGDMGEEVVSVSVKNYADTFTLKSDEIKSISDNGSTITIKTEDKKTLRVDKKGFLIVNGKSLTPSVAMFNAFESGTATFVDSDNNGTYDVIHMTLLLQSIIDAIDTTGMSFGTLYDGNIINLENVDNYEIYLGKKKVAFSDLKPGMPIGIACDSISMKDGKLVYDFSKAEYIRLYASNRKMTGYITAMMDNDKFEIEEMTRSFGSGYLRFLKEKKITALELGSYVTAYFDNMGQLTYFEIAESSDSMKYGYLLKAGVSAGLSKKTQIKVLEANGDFSIYETGKSFILDGKKVNSGSTVYTVNKSDDVDLNKRQLIRYRVVDGTLKEVDTAVIRTSVEVAETSLDAVLPFNGASRRVRSGAIDREYAFKSSCITFVDEAPIGDSDPAEEFLSVKKGVLGDGAFYLSAYDSNLYNEISCVVRHDSYNENETDAKGSLDYYGYNCYVVESVKNTMDSNGEWGWTITVVGDSKKVTHFVSPTGLKLYSTKDADDWAREYINIYKQNKDDFTTLIKTGDIIRFTKNSLGNINYIEKLFDFEDHKNLIVEVPNKSGQIYGFAQVEKISGRNVLYNDNPVKDKTYVFRKRSVYSTVPLYHVSTGEVELVDISKIPTQASGSDVKVFMRYYNYGIIYDHIFYIYD